MNDSPLPSPDAPAGIAGRYARRKRIRNPWPRRMLMVGAGLVLLGLGGVFCIRLWIVGYLKSPAFAAQVNAAAGRTLQAECQINQVTWQDAAAYAGTFEAMGSPDAIFRRLTISDLRAELDTGAIWNRIWKVNQARIEHLSVDFSPGGRLAASIGSARGPAEAGAGPAIQKAPRWLENWLPNRTSTGPVIVEKFDFVREATDETPAMEGLGFSLALKPDLHAHRVEVDSRSGKLSLAGWSHALSVSRMRGTVRTDGAALDQLEGTLADAAVSAEGTIAFSPPGDLRLKVRLAGAKLKSWLPEDWLKRCDGLASIQATLRGDWRLPATIQMEGGFQIKDASLQALPLLEIIARKTQNASFLRMQIKEVTGDFLRRGGEDWQIRRLRADAPGLLRLKGDVDAGRGGALGGSLLLGIVPGTLRFLAGAEQTVFLSASKFSAQPGNASAISGDDSGLLWARFTLGGTLDAPQENLSERLARAWFDATVEQVTSLSMEAAATAARTAAQAANTVLDTAPDIIEKAPGLLDEGVQGGLKLLDSLFPK